MNAPARDWWRPELWLVIGIPLLTVLGGIWTLLAASGELSDDGDHADAKRTAQVQTADIEPDLAAARLGLKGDLQVDRARGEVRVQLPRLVDARDDLELRFVHGLQAGRDLQVRLQPQGEAWVAQAAPSADSRWRVVLADGDRQWRLVGTLPRGAATLALQPALPPP